MEEHYENEDAPLCIVDGTGYRDFLCLRAASPTANLFQCDCGDWT